MQSRAVERDAAILLQRVPQEQEERIRVPLLNGGIRTDKAPCDLAPNEVVTQEALHVVAGRLLVDTGYVPFAAPYDGVAQKVFQALFANDTTVMLLITTTTVYEYAEDVQQWQYVGLSQTHETTAPEVAGATTVSLDNVTDIAIGTPIGIMLDNGVQHQTVVTGVTVLDVDFADAIPVGRSVALGALVAGALTLNGDPALSQVCIQLFSGNDWIVFCNGVNEIVYYDPATNLVNVLPGLPTNTICRTMAVYHDCLFLGNVSENGTIMQRRVRMSDLADPTVWTPGMGIAAIYDLLDTEDPIQVLAPLGPWLVCYGTNTVVRASYIGAFNETVFWEYMVRGDGVQTQGDGAQSQGAVCSIGAEHVIVGKNNIYSYGGDYTLKPIGDGVFANFLAVEGDLWAPAKDTLFTVYVPALREVWILYPSGDLESAPTLPNKMLRLTIGTAAWSTRHFADSVVGSGVFTPQDELTWATAPGVWSDDIWARPWSSRTFTQNIPNIFLCPAEGEQLFVYDYAALTDNGDTIEWEVTTKDFGDGTVFWRWEDVRLLGQGAVLLERSEDEGATWNSLGTLVLGDDIAIGHVDIDRVSTRMMLRLSGDDSTFELRYIHINRVLDSEW